MKFRFSIGRKIGTGFGVLIFLTSVVFYLTDKTLNESRRINDLVHETYNPSVYELEKLSFQLNESQRLMSEWVNIQTGEDNQNKKSLVRLQDNGIPFQMEIVEKLSNMWVDKEKLLADTIFLQIEESLFLKYAEIRSMFGVF